MQKVLIRCSVVRWRASVIAAGLEAVECGTLLLDPGNSLALCFLSCSAFGTALSHV